MDWIPIIFVTFKVLVLGTGMFFAIKWHFDQEMKKGKERREVMRAGGKLVAIFVLALAGLGFVTSVLFRMLGLEG